MKRRMIVCKLKQLLEKEGKTLYWLSKETGVSYNSLKKLRDNETQAISWVVLEAVCEALDREPGDVLVRVRQVTK